MNSISTIRALSQISLAMEPESLSLIALVWLQNSLFFSFFSLFFKNGFYRLQLLDDLKAKPTDAIHWQLTVRKGRQGLDSSWIAVQQPFSLFLDICQRWIDKSDYMLYRGMHIRYGLSTIL